MIIMDIMHIMNTMNFTYIMNTTSIMEIMKLINMIIIIRSDRISIHQGYPDKDLHLLILSPHVENQI